MLKSVTSTENIMVSKRIPTVKILLFYWGNRQVNREVH